MPQVSDIVIGQPLQIADVVAFARDAAAHPVKLAGPARERLQHTRDQLEADLAGGATIYGVNTGFGALSDTRIATDQLAELQNNLLRSHAVGVGAPLPPAVVRTLLLLRAHTLAMGASGVTPQLVDHVLAVLAAGVVPFVPRKGSVGASGDLAPLAHLALPLIGEGRAWVQPPGQSDPTTPDPMPGAEALAAVGVSPLALGPKEGLSLINGTQVTTAVGALATWQAAELLGTADVLGALSLDASLGTVAACDPRIHAGKPHPGQQRSADNILALADNSPLAASHAECEEVQDAYAYRCMPQVHGAVRGALRYVAEALTIEINSFTDNPLVLPRADGSGYDVISGGNFHAATVAVPIDHLTAALTTLATISERRLDRFLNHHTSRGLPPFLADDPGLQSGFMMAQVTASALASECKTLSFPASVDSIPTSAGKEDHVSMGPIAALKLGAVVDNVARVLAIEAAVAARALDLREPSTTPRLQAVYEVIRQYVAPFSGDRSMTEELEALAQAICDGELRRAAGLEDEI